MNERGAPEPGSVDLVSALVDYLRRSGPRFVVVAGAAGAGKSSLLRALFPELDDPKIFMLYQQPMGSTAEGAARPTPGGATSVFLLDPLHAAAPPDASQPPLSAAGAYTGPVYPESLTRAFVRLAGHPRACAVVDSWDRESESFVRELSRDPAELSVADLPATGFGALQSAILELRVNLVLGVVPELATPLASLADALVELREEERLGVGFRLARLPKLRGTSGQPREQLYTLEGGRFRSLPDLPSRFQPPAVAPEADPDPTDGTIWPGSGAFRAAFGRLHFGSLTGLNLGPDCSDVFAMAVTLPLVAHVLRIGGRVVWTPAPSIRPSRVVAQLSRLVPPEFLRERLRLLSASGDDASLEELSSVILRLRREGAPPAEGRGAPGVGPIFPEAHQFLRQTPHPNPALYVMSIEGLKASAAAAGLGLDPVTMPSVLAAYARLPRFHGFGYGAFDDPLAVALQPAVTTGLVLQVVCGRPVIHGVRPRTPAYALDWPGDGRPYALTPLN